MNASSNPEPMIVDKYSVKRGITGAMAIVFGCPACRSPLKCDLTDAGKCEQCLHCHTRFVVPAMKELEAWNAEQDAKRTADAEQQRRQAEHRAARQVALGTSAFSNPALTSDVGPLTVHPISSAVTTAEVPIWRGQPNHLGQLLDYILCGLFFWLVVPLIIGVVRYLRFATTSFTLSTERLRIEYGILNRRLSEIEIYRIKDTAIVESFWERLMGLSTVVIISSDASSRRVHLRCLKDGRRLREMIRMQTERMRQIKQVRTIEMSNI